MVTTQLRDDAAARPVYADHPIAIWTAQHAHVSMVGTGPVRAVRIPEDFGPMPRPPLVQSVPSPQESNQVVGMAGDRFTYERLEIRTVAGPSASPTAHPRHGPDRVPAAATSPAQPLGNA
jgi:hypothetical protein